MEAIAKYNKTPMSALKARKVADVVRKINNVSNALTALSYIPNRAASYIAKTLHAAVANLEYQQKGKSKVVKQNLQIKEIYIDQGRVLKRIQPAPKGRAHPIRKPSCHITIKIWEAPVVAIEEESNLEATSPQISATKEVENLPQNKKATPAADKPAKEKKPEKVQNEQQK